MIKLDRCIACNAFLSGSERVIHKYETRQICRCNSCGVYYVAPQYDQKELAEYYNRTMYTDKDTWQGYGLEKTLQRDRLLHEKSIQLIEQHAGARLPRPARVLDYGCGPGIFLSVARDHGWLADGIEFNRRAVESAKDTFGLDIYEISQFPIKDKVASYDVITAWEVLEHAPQPFEMVKLLFSLLKPGGFVWLASPNPQGLPAKIKGKTWSNFLEPTHLSFFTLPVLRTMLTRAGFCNAKRKYFFGGQAGFLKSLPQYAARVLNLGTDLRVVAEKPHG